MSITTEKIESLLYEDESNTIDFKEKEYSVNGACEKAKRELLKDLLAFANSWRRTDAYILTGIREVKGGRSQVIGIDNHLKDNDLQEFVNSKTQRPLDFSYQVVEFEGKKIGVFRIPLQARPIYLKKDYKKIEKCQVYVRRGSMTAIADPDEIAKMGERHGQIDSIPVLELNLANIKARRVLGRNVDVNTFHLEIPDADEIPDYGDRMALSPWGSRLVKVRPFGANHDYYRELADYYKKTHYVSPIGFSVTNRSEVVAQDVYAEIRVTDPNNRLIFQRESDLPKLPIKEQFQIPDLKPFVFNININKSERIWFIFVRFGKIPPKATVFSQNELYVGSSMPCQLEMPVDIFADNLPSPKRVNPVLNLEIEKGNLDLEHLIEASESQNV